MDYKSDIRLDKMHLDLEWEKQAEKFSDWGTLAAEAEEIRDLLKDKLELIEAEIGREVRMDPINFGLAKITDSAIVEIIHTHERYRAVKEEYLKAVKEARVLHVAEKAFEHKKKALDRLTDLFITGYYSKTSYFDNSEVEEQRKLLSKNLRLRQNFVDDNTEE